LPEGMRGNLAAGEVEEGSFVKGADEDKLGLEDESEGEEERESSEEDSESDEDYFYLDVREIGEPKEWNLRETCSNPREVVEFERTVDPNEFRRTEKENALNRDRTPDQNVDFWEMSNNWQKDRDNLSETSSIPDLEQLIRNLTKQTGGNVRRPRYTEFRERGEEEQQEEEISSDKEIMEQQEEEISSDKEIMGVRKSKMGGIENEDSKSDSEEESGLKTPTKDDGRVRSRFKH